MSHSVNSLSLLTSIKFFITAAALSPEGKNLKLLWGCAFKEGLIAWHHLYGKTEKRLKEVHADAYEQGFQAGYNEGWCNKKHGDWASDGHGMHCGYQTTIPYDNYSSLLDPTATSLTNTDNKVSVLTQTIPLAIPTISATVFTQNKFPAITAETTSQIESTIIKKGINTSTDNVVKPFYRKLPHTMTMASK